MKGRTALTWRSAFVSLATYTMLAVISLNILPTITQAQVVSNTTAKPVNFKTNKEDINWTINTLKRSQARWIEVNLKKQQLIAWSGDKVVLKTTISSGKAKTPTLTGVFYVQRKLELDRMRGPGYDVPNVPHAMYYDRGYAIHGAFWHNKFGTPVSHGCVNVRPKQARWLFNWSKVGTTIVIRNL